jgi:hypothetical protein
MSNFIQDISRIVILYTEIVEKEKEIAEIKRRICLSIDSEIVIKIINHGIAVNAHMAMRFCILKTAIGLGHNKEIDGRIKRQQEFLNITGWKYITDMEILRNKMK